MSITGGIMAGVGLAGSLGGAAISSNAAGNAASQQAQAANNAAQLDYQSSQNALNFQKQQYDTSQQEMQPWLQSGTGAISNLDYLAGIAPQSAGQSSSPYGSLTGVAGPTGGLTANPGRSAAPTGLSMPGSNGPVSGTAQSSALPAGLTSKAASTPMSVPGSTLSTGTQPAAPFIATPSSASPGGYGSLLAPYSGSFTAPTAAQALAMPGEQAQLQLGQQALEQSAAARGGLLTGGTAQAENQLAQGYASTNYQNTYNDAYNTYAAGYNQYNNQQNNEFNKLAALSGMGQTTASQLGTLGANTANSMSNNVLGTAQAMGQQGNNAAAANASGIVGSANAYGGALSGIGNNLSNLALLQQLGGTGGTATYGGSNSDPYGLNGGYTGGQF